jgi:hypothetical protein
MKQSYWKWIGVALMVLGLYWLKDLFLTLDDQFYLVRTIPDAIVVVVLLGGIWVLCGKAENKVVNGSAMIGVAIFLLFLAGTIMRPMRLWMFLWGFSALFGGFKVFRDNSSR